MFVTSPNLFFRHKRTLLAIAFVFIYAVSISYAVPPTTKYQPGETLDPSCAPTDLNCSVQILPSQTGNATRFLTTDGTVVSWSSHGLVLGGDFETIGNNTLALTTTAATALTLPTTGTLATTTDINTAVSGTTNYIPKFTGANTIGDSLIYDTGTVITIGGDTVIGANAANTVVFNGKVASSIGVSANNTYDIGSASYMFRNIYVDTITANSISAGNSAISGSTSNGFTFNSDNISNDIEDITLIFDRGTQPNALLTWNSTADRFEFDQTLAVTTLGVGVVRTNANGVFSSDATTTDLTEGTNLYYTQARFNAALALKTTDDISDSLNKRYVTDANLTTIGNQSGINTGDQTTITGNAATATKLLTARTLWGQSFDGTANVSGALTGVTGITTTGGYTQSGTSANTFTGELGISKAFTTNGNALDILTSTNLNGGIIKGQNISVTGQAIGTYGGATSITFGQDILVDSKFSTGTGTNVVLSTTTNSGNSPREYKAGKFVTNGAKAASTAVNQAYYGIYAKADNGGATGETTSTSTGVYGEAIGVVTNYGGYFKASGGVNNWGVYSALGNNFFSGSVLIGSATDDGVNKLQVTGGGITTTGGYTQTGSPSNTNTFVSPLVVPRISINDLSYPYIGINNSYNMTGYVQGWSNYTNSIIQSGVTSIAYGNQVRLGTAAAAFNVTDVNYFHVQQGTLGAGSSITNQYGYATGNLTNGTNNYGFYGGVNAATNNWNSYMGGSAKNYFNGSVLIGSATDGGEKLQVTGTARITGNITTSGGYTQTGTSSNTFTGVTTISTGTTGKAFQVLNGDIYLGADTYGQDGAIGNKQLRMYQNSGSSPYLVQGAARSSTNSETTFFRSYVNSQINGKLVFQVGNGLLSTANGVPSSYTEVMSLSSTGNLNIANALTNTIASFDASKNLVSLSTATYPSLTELSYVKGVTSAVQVQMDLKSNIASPTFTGTVTAPTFIGALTGNAATATNLATARTLWGQSFDGTANVSGALTGVTGITSTGNISVNNGISAGFTQTNGTDVLSTYVAVGYGQIVVTTNAGLLLFTNNLERIRILAGGNVGIGSTTAPSLLSVGTGGLFQVNSSGAIVASAGITTSGGYTQSGTSANLFTGTTQINSPTGGSGTGLKLVQAANNGTTASSFVPLDFYAQTTGLVGSISATASNYSNASLNLLPNSISVISGTTSGQLGLFAAGASGLMTFNVGGYAVGNEAMRILANRNVLIGSTTDDGLSKLQVTGSGRFNNGTYSAINTGWSGSFGYIDNNYGVKLGANGYGGIVQASQGTNPYTLSLQPFGGNINFGAGVTSVALNPDVPTITLTGTTTSATAGLKFVSSDVSFRAHAFGLGGNFYLGTTTNNALAIQTSYITRINISGAGDISIPSATASTLASFDASKNLVSLSTATYPSLTELSYVKGLTSPAQTQMDLKSNIASPTFTGTVTTRGASSAWSTSYKFNSSDDTVLGGFGAYGSTSTLNRFFIGTYNTDEKMSLLANGNVGIGTTAPTQKLDVAGSIALNGTRLMTLPDQSTLTGSLIYGTGGGNLVNTTGDNGRYNTLFGIGAGKSLTTGSYSTANGYNAGYSNTTGSNWTANGYAAGYSSTTGNNWTANGMYAGYYNTTGINWTANGMYAGFSNTTGNYWTANGYNAGFSSTTGNNWTANGMYAGYSNTTGINWTANGYAAGYSNTTGNYWTANGMYAGYSNTTGNNWTANGYQAGRFLADGATGAQVFDNSTYIGANTKVSAENVTNENVFGYNATGNGSNSITLGDDNITKTVLKGNVGINTTNPLTLLHLSSNAANDIFQDRSSANALSSTLYMRKSRGTPTVPTIVSADDQVLHIGARAYDGAAYQDVAAIKMAVDGTPSAGDMPGRITFSTTLDGATTLSERMRITNAGNVGINTATPLTKLDVVSTVANAGQVARFINNQTTGITTSANVGFVAYDGSASSAMGALTATASTWSYGTYVAKSFNVVAPTAATGGLQLRTASSPITFLTGNADPDFSVERMRILANGNVGIGTAAPGYLLHVGSSSVTTGTTVARFENAGGTCDIIPSTAGGISCTSDMNLKKNITLLDGQSWSLQENLTTQQDTIMDRVMMLRPVMYNMLSESNSTALHGGFIAQEVEQLFPDLVRTDKEGFKSMNYAGLMPYTIAAVQQMNLNITLIDDMERENTWRNALLQWFASATNGIQSFVAGSVRTRELCITDDSGETCLTRSQVQQLMQGNSGSGVSTPPVDAPSGEVPPTTPDEPVVDPVVPEAPAPTPEPTPDPAPTPDQEPAPTPQAPAEIPASEPTV